MPSPKTATFSTPSSRISVPLERCPLILNPTPRVLSFWLPLALPDDPASPFEMFPEISTKSYGLRVKLGNCASCSESTTWLSSCDCVFTCAPPSAITCTSVTLVLIERRASSVTWPPTVTSTFALNALKLPEVTETW